MVDKRPAADKGCASLSFSTLSPLRKPLFSKSPLDLEFS